MTRVLLVCSANVCRSPAMAIGFATAAREGGVRVDVVSAGRLAEPGAMICAVTAEAVGVDERSRKAATDHRAQRLSAELIESAGLILGATREERAAVAVMSPRSRSRVFTIAEAVALGEIAAERRFAPASGDVDEFVAALNAHRGRLPVTDRRVGPGRQSPWRRAPADPLDLPDAHGSRRAEHSRRVREAVRLSERLVALMASTS